MMKYVCDTEDVLAQEAFSEDEQLREQMGHLSETFRRIRHLHIERLTGDLKQNEMMTLHMVFDLEKKRAQSGADKRIRVSDIVRKLKVPPPLVSRTLKELEEKGLLFRETDRKDRRNTFILLTEKGREQVHEADAAMIDFMKEVVQENGTAQTEQMLREVNQFLDVFAGALNRRIKNRKESEL